jgi:ABC-type Zn uptake system ZnuABC Zn-binding protein ZnuA
MRYPLHMKLWLSFGLAILAGGVLAGCDKADTPASNPVKSSRISVLVTVYPMVDMVKRIGGDRVDVEWLAESGQRPEELEATPDLRRRLSKANMVVTSGPWDLWMSSELTADARSSRNVEPDRTAAGREVEPKAYPWLDPAVIREMIEPLRLHLLIQDSAHEAQFTTRAAEYRAEVDAVDQDIRQALNLIPGRRMLAVRPVWRAMCRHYGLSLLTPVEATEARLTAADFREIARVAKANELKTIFVDADTSTALRQQIEEKTGLKTVELDAMGSSAADGRNTWAKLMRFNLEQLKKGL